MEPMNLGSPTHQGFGSPSSPMSPGSGSAGAHHQSLMGQQQSLANHQGGGYLPGYLMGDPLSPNSASPINSRQLGSPGKLNRSHSNMTTSGMGSVPTTPHPMAPSRQHSLFREAVSTSGRVGGRSDKTGGGGGPPTINLMSTVNNTPNSAFNSPFSSTNLDAGTPGGVASGAASRLREDDMTVASGGMAADPLSVWVTVFGFPPSAASFIVTQLGACGTILNKNIPTNGNWMHLRFQTKLQARKALSKNGTVLNGTIMIGVRPCTDDSVLELGNATCGNASLLETSCNGSQIANLSTGFGTPRQIRPLTQAFKEAQTENKVVPATNTPSKDSGIVNKALEYMFGW